MNTVLPLLESRPGRFELPESARAGLTTTPFGLYVHVPFCATRCGYCDFNTYTSDELGPGANRAEYAGTAIAELRRAADTLGPDLPTVSTVFVGGGTPTLLPADDLAAVLGAARDLFPVAADVEVTTEANPESVTPASLARLRAAGFTRISLGMQSAAEHVLAVLDRRHTPGRAVEAAHEARAAGFEHVNLDLIYGAPGETDADWAASLDAVLAGPVDHVSAYALIVEHGTRLARRIQRGELPMPDDDVLADRYEMADATLRGAGFDWYEVSNWATSEAARCRHNELYWANANWWGIGPGAHSHVGGLRWWNVKHPAAYADRVNGGQSPAQDTELLDDADRALETIMLGLRLREGLPLAALSATGRVRARDCVARGLLEPGRARCRPRRPDRPRPAARRRRDPRPDRLRTPSSAPLARSRRTSAGRRHRAYCSGMGRFDVLRRIEELDPARDFAEIYRLLTTYEFPWDMNQALSFALFRTYAVPSIGALLARTAELTERTQKRYDDTVLILDAVMEHGSDSSEGRAAIRRMNQMHRSYEISNDDLRYVLATFVVMPIRWLDDYGWRPLTEIERVASANYYRDLGRHMGIREIPETWQAFARAMDAYERKHFGVDDGARRVAESTLTLVATFPPNGRLPAALVRRISFAMMDGPLLDAFGFPHPSRVLRALVRGGLKGRGRVVRFLPPRSEPLFPGSFRRFAATRTATRCPHSGRSRLAARCHTPGRVTPGARRRSEVRSKGHC